MKKDYFDIQDNYDYNRNPLMSHNHNRAKNEVCPQITRKGVTYKKYQQLCGARQEKVRQFMIRGYPQSLIGSKLRISPSTISRDMHRINQEHDTKRKDYCVK